ncbi:MAG: hypothetical protein P4L69_09920 [Desulfosporosinus sp.]|nr:hypothetical protein [Desulfosporosinus sp.]
MQTSKFIMSVALVLVMEMLLGCYPNSQSSQQQQTQQVTTPSQDLTKGLGYNGLTETLSQPINDVIWLPDHRLQTICKDRVDVVFMDTKHGWKMVPGQGAMNSEPVDIYQTTDGGESWIKTAVANQKNVSASESTNLFAGTLPYEGIKNGLSFVNSSTGWITG